MVEQYHQLEKRLAQAWAPATWRDVTVLVAVSGGADSVALLLALCSISEQTSGRLIAVHFNHRLRGAESDADERFVLDLCQQLDIPCDVAQAQSRITSRGDGVEAAARQQRYHFLRNTAHHRGARYVATGHTADDQAETILYRIIRGTGLAGLAGIPLVRPLSEMTTVIRPMLSVSRADVQAYLRHRDQPYREDSSNNISVFARNRIRHQLMPMLANQFNPQVASALLRLGHLARETQTVVDTAVEPLLQASLLTRTETRVDLTRTTLLNVPPILVREMLVRIWNLQQWPRRDMNEWQWNRLATFLQAPPPSASGFTLPGNIQVSARDDRVFLQRG